MNVECIVIVKTSCMIFNEYYLKFYKKELTCFILVCYFVKS